MSNEKQFDAAVARHFPGLTVSVTAGQNPYQVGDKLRAAGHKVEAVWGKSADETRSVVAWTYTK
jgi:hypothetical protein